jgi:hypothetical protein
MSCSEIEEIQLSGQICSNFHAFITGSLLFLNTRFIFYHTVQRMSQVFCGTCTVAHIQGIMTLF